MLTDIGSSPVVGAVVLITALWALSRGRRIEAAALVIGATLSFAASRTAKAFYDRPRPEGSLVDTIHASFPSGHALYSVALVACAVVLVRAGAGWATRFALVTVSVVVVVLVAASRVYLRAHYLTDVLGGLALGTALWSLVGIGADCRRGDPSQWARTVSTDDKITYAVAGVAALVSLTAWVMLIVIPAWGSYWRLRERLLAVVMSVYILAAFVVTGGRRRRDLPLLLRSPLESSG